MISDVNDYDMETVALPSEEIPGPPSGAIRNRIAEELRHLTPALHALAASRLSGRGNSEDAVQETFVRVWRNLDRYRPEAPLQNWVFTIAANVVRNMARRERVRRQWTPAPLEETSLDPTEALVNAEDLRRIYDVLDRLDAAEVAPLLLHYVHGVSQKDVASFLGLPVEHLRVRLFRTIRKIRTGVQEEKW